MKSYKAIGIMSGTSLDGLDIVFCHFTFQKNWKFELIKSITIDYSKHWKEKLAEAPFLNGYELTKFHKQYGKFIGDSVNQFIKNSDFQADLVASHGHTIFHQPDKKLTLQIGDGYEIATTTEITTICDFRSLDIALGGQGAPLVPIGDELLFSDYNYCLNIGGFANISFNNNGNRCAYDIGPANIILNYLTNKLGHDYDKNGALGLLGKTNTELLEKLNSLEYYSNSFPKSLGREWLDSEFIPVLDKTEASLHDKLRTVYEHIAIQISKALNSDGQSKTLVTGGGAYNKLLINLTKQKTKSQLVIPNKELIDYKEAIIFALLGVLKLENEVNCLASVTGAKKDSSSGVIYSI